MDRNRTLAEEERQIDDRQVVMRIRPDLGRLAVPLAYNARTG
jgi:hypothetical protein